MCLISSPSPSASPIPRDLADLRTYATRAKAVDDGAIRLQAAGPVLAAYVCVLRPRLLGESTPTILGLRTMGLAEPSTTDVTVPLAAVLDRLARAGENDAELPVPPSTVTESWAGVGAPRSGWELVGAIAGRRVSGRLRKPASPKWRASCRTTRAPSSSTTPAPRSGAANSRGSSGLPAGAAFAALALGFLGSDEQRLYRAGPLVPPQRQPRARPGPDRRRPALAARSRQRRVPRPPTGCSTMDSAARSM